MNRKNKIKITLTSIYLKITNDINKVSEIIYKRFKNNTSILEIFTLEISKKFKDKKYVQGILTIFELVFSFVLTVIVIVYFIFPILKKS